MTLTLCTARLTLRLPVAGDAPAIARGLNNFAVARWLGPVPFPYGETDAHHWLGSLPAEQVPLDCNFAIDLHGHGLVGCISHRDEIGYWLAEPFWGQGLATEAAAAVIAWHFDHGVPQIRSGIIVGNDASLNVQHKLGFVQTGTSTMYSRPLGRQVDRVDTLLTRDAFLAPGGRS